MEENRNELVPVIEITAGTLQSNLEALETKVRAIAEAHKGIVLTDIPQGKKIRTDLRNLQTAINAEKVKAKKRFLEPFDALEEKVKAFIALLEEPIIALDIQIKDAEEQVRMDRRIAIDVILKEYASKLPTSVAVFLYTTTWHRSEKWTAESCWTATGNPTKALKDEIAGVVQKCGNSVATIQNVAGEFTSQVLEGYRKSGDLGIALAELASMQAAKDRAENMRVERVNMENREHGSSVSPHADVPEPKSPVKKMPVCIPPTVLPRGAHIAPRVLKPALRSFTLCFTMTESDFQSVREVLDIAGIEYMELPF